MADIELVITIPEEIRLALINYIQLSLDQQSICDSYIKQAIINGTPLPELYKEKALEQESCEDAISRQEAVEAFQMFREYESNRSNKEWVDRIETVLNQLPSVNPQPKWIPVSERLPEFAFNNTVSEDVLVFDGLDIRVGEYRKGKYLNGAGYWRVYGYELTEYFDVIAWMPLPEPYKAESEEIE